MTCVGVRIPPLAPTEAAVTREAVQNAARPFQSDFDLVAECASAAINDRASAKMPADFAASQGKTFPSAIMPDPLPEPVAAVQSVVVPDFSTCTSKGACQELARASGLTVAFTTAGPEAGFSVLGFEPPKDQPVALGSTVTITCPSSPPSDDDRIRLRFDEQPRAGILVHLRLPDPNQ